MSSLFHQLYRQRPCYRYHHIYHCVLVTYYPLFQKYNEKKVTKSNILAHPFYPVILTAISTDNKHGSVPTRSSLHVRCTLQRLQALCNVCRQFQERSMMQQPHQHSHTVASSCLRLLPPFGIRLIRHYGTLNRLL